MRDTEFPALTPHELATTGQALYGAAWRAALAGAFGVDEADIVAVESGREVSPGVWRAQLIALAQNRALRAMEAANDLLWRTAAEAGAPMPPPPRPSRIA